VFIRVSAARALLASLHRWRNSPYCQPG